MPRPLFESLQELEDRVAQARHVLLCLDFDGTLAPIADHPSKARLPEPTRQLLCALANHYAVSVTVISGREKVDLKAHIDVPGVIYAGNHGLEIGGPGVFFVEPVADMFRESLKELAADLTTRLQTIPGALVEEKGLTLSVHYRRVPTEMWEEVRRIVHGALANASHPFLLNPGKLVYEIGPRVYWNKGNAVLWLQEHLGEEDVLTIYVGDDATDENAFASLQNAVTIKVGDSQESGALFQLSGPAEVRTFLEWLLNQVGEMQGQLTP
jgi:trehalose 6-phosphate phosphatase